ncbi:chemotaxis protein [Sapientia aquatica]|uniref:Chemotaxis signal transduction protein CheV n=1 Tax=Sapientia aquatica TaxID=1549640 RepID=A0A4R5W6T6_9BURK|nr:chemotaxis protein [Sapientia aquatica]TDK68680.1 chemotaxis signal transduction protein CheV [Sapientia aquatica]
MSSIQQEIDERTNLTASNKFELLLFRLGIAKQTQHSELFGINVFKVREIVAMPSITEVAGAVDHMLGVVNLRGQIIPVIDLPGVVGCVPSTGLNILLVTEYARSTQGFAVESVEEIVRLDWGQVLSAESSSVAGMVTSIARLDGDIANTRLAQVLDVEQILRSIQPEEPEIDAKTVGPSLLLPPGTVILAADDSHMARTLIERGLTAMGAPFIMTKTGKECWEKLQALSNEVEAQGKTIHDKVALVLTDLEMPEMDGFTLTRKIKHDTRFQSLPVVIHSSLTGSTNEEHVKNVGADAYVAKFVAEELASTIRRVLADAKLKLSLS